MGVRTWHITAADSEAHQRRVAGTLRSRGLEPGDRVVLRSPNSPELLAAVLGALRVGIVPVLLHSTLLDAEVGELVADADPSFTVLDEQSLTSLFDGPEADLAPVPLARPMHYTSGTSGRPKGVWSGVLDEADAEDLFADEADLWGFSDRDVHVTCSPLSHSVAVRFSASCLLRGGDVVLLERFDAAALAGVLAEHRPTSVFMVPAHLQRLFSHGPLPDVAGLRRVVHAGAPCPEPLKRRALDEFPEGSVWEFYGSTEGQFTVCGPDQWLDRPGTVGRARPGRRLEVVDGTVWCHVPPSARFEYWRAPEKTAAAWRGDAFTVGDLGRLDDDGFLFLDGRRDDLIISGGVNVYPLEVEQAMAGLPGVEEVAVFGVDDERWGQRVCAAVVGDADADALLGEVRRCLAAYKCPKDVYVVDDLPRTSTGKVRRSQIARGLGLEPDDR